MNLSQSKHELYPLTIINIFAVHIANYAFLLVELYLPTKDCSSSQFHFKFDQSVIVTYFFRPVLNRNKIGSCFFDTKPIPSLSLKWFLMLTNLTLSP